MNSEKKNYEFAEIKVVKFDRDMLITSSGSLEDEWPSIDFSQL